jgi:hypothetical protein
MSSKLTKEHESKNGSTKWIQHDPNIYIYVFLPFSTPTRPSELPKSADKSQLAQHPRKSEVVPAGPPPEEM